MVSHWQPMRFVAGLRRVRTQSVDAPHDWPGFSRRRCVCVAAVVVRRCARPRVVAALRYLHQNVKAFVITAFLLLLAYICFYAKYTVWSGDFAWGDRYVSSAAEMAAFISVPLLLRHRAQLGKFVWVIGTTLIALSLAIQVASLAFWLPLEIYQMDTLGHPTFVVALRFKNIVAFALGKMEAWGLTNSSMTYDPWDYVHITTWNLLPFLLRRVGAAPRWVVDMAFAAWFVALGAVVLTLWRLRRTLRNGEFYQ